MSLIEILIWEECPLTPANTEKNINLNIESGFCVKQFAVKILCVNFGIHYANEINNNNNNMILAATLVIRDKSTYLILSEITFGS